MKKFSNSSLRITFLILLLAGIFTSGGVSLNANAADSYDTTPPTKLSGFSSNAFHTANSPAVVDVWWHAAEDNVGVFGYVLERSIHPGFANPVIYNLDSVTSYRDKTVKPSTTYYWRIKAKDAAGNLSPEWTNLTATTRVAPVVNKQFTIEGDSASVGYGLTGYVEGPPESYSAERWGEKLGDLLDGTWVVRTVAAGGGRILGDITADRKQEITPLRQPKFERDIVLLWAGTNDIYGLPSRGIAPTAPVVVYKGMKSYVNAVKADGFEVWIMSAYPRSAFGFADKNAERIAFNNLIRADNSFADKFLDIDAWSEFKSNLYNVYYLADNTHLSRLGNQLVAERVYAELVKSPLVIFTPSTLSEGKIGTAYSQVVESSGGNGKRAVSLVTGKMPAGLKLVNETIQGTPLQPGNFSFMLQVKDSLGTSVNRKYNLTISK